eukprot:scaffold34221_cov101-Isochrysis_galbana.AAC.1
MAWGQGSAAGAGSGTRAAGVGSRSLRLSQMRRLRHAKSFDPPPSRALCIAQAHPAKESPGTAPLSNSA